MSSSRPLDSRSSSSLSLNPLNPSSLSSSSSSSTSLSFSRIPDLVYTLTQKRLLKGYPSPESLKLKGKIKPGELKRKYNLLLALYERALGELEQSPYPLSFNNGMARDSKPNPVHQAYFANTSRINLQHPLIKDLSTNILIGPKGNGFNNTMVQPFCSKDIDPLKLQQIKVAPEQCFGIKGEFAMPINKKVMLFDYDPNKTVQRRILKSTDMGLTLEAYTSELAEVNLPSKEKTQYGINQKATHFQFISPVNALGGALKQYAESQLENELNRSPSEEEIVKRHEKLNSDFIKQLIGQYGPDFAALMYIGGYAYYNEKNELIQVKALVAETTSNLLQIKNPISSTTLPRSLQQAFDRSIGLLKTRTEQGRPSPIRDGLTFPVTSPELLERGATHFAWIPPLYKPEGITDPVELNAYNLLWKTHPSGFFMYHFINPRYNCTLAIGIEKPENNDSLAKRVTIVDHEGQAREITAFVEENCLNCTEIPPNIVFENVNGSYDVALCTDCNSQYTDQLRNALKRKTVIAVHNLQIHPRDLKPNDQSGFFNNWYMRPIKNFRMARIEEMATSKESKVTLQNKSASNIPESAMFFTYLYPAEILAKSTTDPQLKNLYTNGGFAYFDHNHRLVRINEPLRKKENGTKLLPFKQAEEITLPKGLEQHFIELIEKKQLPFVQDKSVRALGVEFQMWVSPNDNYFNHPDGAMIYFSADGHQVFAKAVG